jgi:N-acetyltransferase 10
MMSLYVSSHYKNSPNDLQLMSDAPAHHLFVLLGPVSSTNTMPDILAVIQVCLEGSISRESVLKALARGERASGDLIPWCISQQYQNQEFASLNGARIVRIATNPEVARFGYGSRAIELLAAYYEGKITNLSEGAAAAAAASASASSKAKSTKAAKASGSRKGTVRMDADGEGADGEGEGSDADADEGEEGEGEEIDTSNLLSEVLAPRKSLPPLLTSLQDRAPEPLHYLGVSYGLTQELFNFWSKAKFTPLYLRLTPNELTGEHTCIMIRNLHESENSALETLSHTHWLEAFHTDFLSRFQHLLSFNFAKFSASLALSLLVDPSNSVLENGGGDAKAAAAGGASTSSKAASPAETRRPPMSTSNCRRRRRKMATRLVQHMKKRRMTAP